jgi:hypothetical protein
MSELEQALWQAFDGSLMVGNIAKHAEHDQKTHGKWANGRAVPLPSSVGRETLNPEWFSPRWEKIGGLRAYLSRVADNKPDALSDEEWEAHLSEAAGRFADSIRGGSLEMRIGTDDLESVVYGFDGAGGVFLNQHEVGDSKGFFGPEKREHVEALSGVAYSTDPEDRPKYGYIGGTEWSEDVYQYGDVVIRFRDSVASRTTVSFGDTLNDNLSAVRLTDLLDGSANPERVFRAADSYTHVPVWDDVPRFTDYGYISYVEAQYHGKLSLDDVKEVVFTHMEPFNDYEQGNRLIQTLLDRGITVKANDYYDEEVEIKGIREPIDMDDDGWVLEGTDEERRG